jgi:hypothetical protein
MQNNQLQVAFKEMYKLAELIMSIPSSTATVERSSSDVKRIHTCCRGTQTQERLCGLSILAVEKTFIKQLLNTELYKIHLHNGNTWNRTLDNIEYTINTKLHSEMTKNYTQQHQKLDKLRSRHTQQTD